MNPDLQAQLAQLRDIRVPHEVGLWPLAPGWWMLIAVFVIALLTLASWRVLRRYGAGYLALRELDAIPADDSRQFATELSMLLRRVARSAERRKEGRNEDGKQENVLLLSGSKWAGYLSDTGLQKEIANYLANAAYAAQPVTIAADSDMRDAARTWIRRQT